MKQASRSFLTIALLLSFLAGAGIAGFYLPTVEWLIVALGFGLLLILCHKKFPSLLLIGLLLIGAASGMLRYEFALRSNDTSALARLNDRPEKIQLIGQIIAEPDRRSDHTKYVLDIKTYNNENIEQEVQGKVLIKTQKVPFYFYGDVLQLQGKLQKPFVTQEFDYGAYLARSGIGSVMYYPQLKKISSDHGNIFLKSLYGFKVVFENKINQIFPEPQASLMAGLLIGSRRGIPPDVLDQFNITGLTHIIAISGYNIALVIAFITVMFGKFLPRRWQLPVAVIFIMAFTLLVGASPAVVRAAIMGILAFAALTIGRQYHVALAIVFTAVLMTLWNPYVLQDVSFQLSFAAVLGLLFVSPLLKRYLLWLPNKFAARESLLMTLSAQVTAVPLIVFYFARLSLVAPLANILVAPAIPLAMLLGALAVLLGWIFLPLGLLIGFLAYGLLTYILKIAEWGAALPFASLTMDNFTFVFIVIYYAVLIGFLVYRNTTSSGTLHSGIRNKE